MISNFSLAQPPIKCRLVSHTSFKHSLVIEPLLPGFGHTLGNSLRRVLLSSIPGTAVTRIRINDITHEYQAIAGVVEDAFDLILNLKAMRVKILSDDEKVILNLSKNSEGEVLAGDFSGNSKVEIVNPEMYICYLNSGFNLDIEIEITKGVGYLSVDEINLADNANPQDIFVDALFSPVTNTTLEVEQVRVGDKTNFDRLSLSFETDGSITGENVANFVLSTTLDLFQKIYSSFQSSEVISEPVKNQSLESTADVVDINTNEKINLPARIKNILEKNGVVTNSQLMSQLSEVDSFAGITEKSMATIKDYLKSIS